MTLSDLLGRLKDVKGGGGQYSARCPAHDDRRASLSVGVGDGGKILLQCHAGCSTEAIVEALGLKMSDLFTDDAKGRFPAYNAGQRGKPAEIVAVYNYGNGAQKIRRADKSFSWRQKDGFQPDKYLWKKPDGPLLYVKGDPAPGQTVLVAEGEKDVDTLARLGYAAACGPDGAGPGKWKNHADGNRLQGCIVGVIPDNDQVGRAYAEETCACLQGIAANVYLLDLATVWPEIPEHGDVSDMVEALGDEEACNRLADLIHGTKEWSEQDQGSNPGLISLFRPMSDFKEEKATWIVPGWIPEAQITLIAADGGVGKTTLWVHIVAALSSGSPCILDPPGFTRTPQKIVFCTTEDSIRKKLLRKLREAGANLENIRAMDLAADRDGALRHFKFGTETMDATLRQLAAAMIVFDPVQGFVPPEINMGSRNAMRDCLAPLISVGEDIGSTFLIIVHTNKRHKAFGRDRIADSADLWDIARSVLMCGYTEAEGVRYLSQEKNNYTSLQETVLFSIDDSGQIQKEGTSWKRDRDYVLDADVAKTAPKKEDCKAHILRLLEEADGTGVKSSELGNKLHVAGHAFETIKRAKSELKNAGRIRYYTVGQGKGKGCEWYVALGSDGGLEDLPEDTPVPW